MDKLLRDFTEEVDYVMSLLKLELQTKLQTQGYGTKTSSKLQQTMEHDVKPVATLIVASMYMEDYFVFVENPTPASRIPFGGPKTGARVSKYIQALIRYWRVKRGLSAKKAKSAAFATARVHKKEGRPTRRSFSYSKDGTRTGFIETTLNSLEQRVFEILERRIGDDIELAFSTMLRSIGGIKSAA